MEEVPLKRIIFVLAIMVIKVEGGSRQNECNNENTLLIPNDFYSFFPVVKEVYGAWLFFLNSL